MKVLHAAFQAGEAGAFGILSQMEMEQEAALSIGLDWHVRLFCPQGVFEGTPIVERAECETPPATQSVWARAVSWVSLRRAFYEWLREQENYYDVLLVRHGGSNPYHTQFMVGRKKPVLSVHHTLETESYNDRKAYLKYPLKAVEAATGPRAIAASSGVIGVTQEIVDYELKRANCHAKPSYVYPNGTNYERCCEDWRSNDRIELLFLSSSFGPWRGLDLLMGAVRASERDFVIHVVGGVPGLEKGIAEDDLRVRLHGYLSHEQIRTLAAQCSVGLSSFALFRKNMKQAAALKVREYLMLGLPVYAGHQDVFPETFPYFRQGPCSIDAIMGFAAMHGSSQRSDVADSARPYIEKSALLHDLYKWLRDHVDNTRSIHASSPFYDKISLPFSGV